MKFRKKPVIIEAVQWQGDLKAFTTFPVSGAYIRGNQMFIKTLEGIMTADIGDWIIKGVKGEFYPIKDDIFQETYEAV
jgi:hypothetical protein